MAQRIQVVLIDAIDGSEASETIVFALEGKEYSIDLNAKHANQLRDAFAPFVQHASPRKRRATAAAAKSGPAPAEIRAWAQEMGHEVPARGRIPAHVREAYEAAH